MNSITNPSEEVDNNTAEQTNKAEKNLPENDAKEKKYMKEYQRLLDRLLDSPFDRRTRDEKEAQAMVEALSSVYRIGDARATAKPKGSYPKNQYQCRLSNQPKPPADWHKFSKSLAIELNPKQPDITGALIIYNLSLWMKLAERGVKKTDYCYRSLSELAQDLPYLAGGIEHALERLEEKLKDSFKVLRNGPTLRFRLSKELRKRMDKDVKLMFRIDDAKAYGVREAILLANLSWQMAPSEKAPLANRPSLALFDDDDIPYYEMSPTKLTKAAPDTGPILPMSRFTVIRTLNELVEKKVILAHPTKKTYYTIISELSDEKRAQLLARAKQTVAERDTIVAERDGIVAERDSYLCTYSNELVTGDSKVTSLPTDSASPSPCGEQASPSLKRLMHFVAQDIKAIESRISATKGIRQRYTTVPASQLPYDIIRNPSQVLPYEYFPTSFDGKTIYTRNHYIEEYLQEFASRCRTASFRYTKADLVAIRNIFYAVPDFTTEQFQDIIHHLVPNRMPLFGPADLQKPRKGKWDALYFARKVKDAKSLLRYLPELIEEMHTYSCYYDGEELVKSCCMEESYEDVIAFLRSPRTVPVVVTEHECNPILEMCTVEEPQLAAA